MARDKLVARMKSWLTMLLVASVALLK
jgi:hypothetical protein